MAGQRQALVYGAGAVGSIFGWRLSQQGYAGVSVVCRSNYESVRDNGFAFQTRAWGNGSFRPLDVYKAGQMARQSTNKRFDVVVCATKITTEGDYAAAIRDIRPFVDLKTTLVSTQNGMDVEIPLKRAFPRNTILSAVCNIGCTQLEPGHVVQTALIKPHAFHIGIHTDGIDTHDSLKVRNSLVAADPKFKSIDSVLEERWRKLIFNCAFNSTCALTGLDSLELLKHPGAAELIYHLSQEANEIAAASGISFGDDFPSKVIALARENPAIVPSSLQDVRAGRVMELGPIFGYLMTQASQLGINVPHLRVIYDLLIQLNDQIGRTYLFRDTSASSMLELSTSQESSTERGCA